VQISSIRIQRARSEREKFHSAQSRRFYFFGSSFTDKMIRAQSPITRSNIGKEGLLRWAPKIPSSPFVNRCTKQVIPNWWVSGGVFIFIYMASFLQLQVETPIASLYKAEQILCRSCEMSCDCDVTFLSENFAVLWLAFLHFVAAVEVTSFTPNSALLNTGFVIHFSV